MVSAIKGKEGIELCQRVMPDLIILDLMLPVLSGDNVLKQLRTFNILLARQIHKDFALKKSFVSAVTKVLKLLILLM